MLRTVHVHNVTHRQKLWSIGQRKKFIFVKEKFKIMIKNLITTKKNIKLSPLQRKEICNDLKYESPIVVGNKLVEAAMDDEDYEPSYVPCGVFRTAKIWVE